MVQSNANCGQEYFHSSRNCKLPPRCMRCGNSHKSSECTYLDSKTKKIPDSKVKCVNCKRNHTSNSKECPIRQQILHQREQAITQKRKNATQMRYVHQTQNFDKYFPSLPQKNSNFVINSNNNEHMKYSASARQSVKFNSATQPNVNSNLFSLQFNEMINICTNCKTKSEQLIALTAIFEKYMSNE